MMPENMRLCYSPAVFKCVAPSSQGAHTRHEASQDYISKSQIQLTL